MQKLTRIHAAMLAAVLTLIPAFVNAQADIKVDINKESSSSSTTWYTNPIVWIIGAAVFILLLVALLRGNSRRD